jgi:hypothetical protein
MGLAQQAIHEGGLAVVNMRDDGDISDVSSFDFHFISYLVTDSGCHGRDDLAPTVNLHTKTPDGEKPRVFLEGDKSFGVQMLLYQMDEV